MRDQPSAHQSARRHRTRFPRLALACAFAFTLLGLGEGLIADAPVAVAAADDSPGFVIRGFDKPTVKRYVREQFDPVGRVDTACLRQARISEPGAQGQFVIRGETTKDLLCIEIPSKADMPANCPKVDEICVLPADISPCLCEQDAPKYAQTVTNMPGIAGVGDGGVTGCPCPNY